MKNLTVLTLFLLSIAPGLWAKGGTVPGQSPADATEAAAEGCEDGGDGSHACPYVIKLTYNAAHHRFDLDSLPQDIKPGQFYRVVIEGINTNLYRVELGTEDTQLYTPQSTPLPTDLGSLEEISSWLAAASNLFVAGGTSTDTTAATGTEEVAMALQAIKTSVLAQFPVTDGSENAPPETELIKAFMDETDRDHQGFLNRVNAEKETLDGIQLSVYTHQMEAMIGKEAVVADGQTAYDTTLAKVKTLRAALDILVKEIEIEGKAYGRYSDEKDLANNEAFKERDAEIKQKYTELLANAQKLQAAVSAASVQKMVAPLIKVTLNRHQHYASLVKRLSQDQTEVSISLVPLDTALGLPTYQTAYTLPTVQRFYLSAGASYYWGKLQDQAFSINPTNNQLVQEQTSSWERGFAAQLRGGYKFKKDNQFGAHTSIGVGVPLGTPTRPRLLVGAGLSFGKRHMLAVDAGAITGVVNQLSGAFAVGQTYTTVPETFTVSRVRTNVYFSLGYVYQFGK